MNFRIDVIFHYLSAWQVGMPAHTSSEMGAASGSSSYNFSCTINELPDKKLKHCNVNVNYKNISYYILFVFIILTCSIKNIRPF